MVIMGVRVILSTFYLFIYFIFILLYMYPYKPAVGKLSYIVLEVEPILDEESANHMVPFLSIAL